MGILVAVSPIWFGYITELARAMNGAVSDFSWKYVGRICWVYVGNRQKTTQKSLVKEILPEWEAVEGGIAVKLRE